jgi:hypothetical protein
MDLRVLRPVPYRTAIDKSMLDRENDATLDCVFAVEYLFCGLTRSACDVSSPWPILRV